MTYMPSHNQNAITSNNMIYITGVTWFILNIFTSILNDVITKFVGDRLPIAEVGFFRFLFGMLSLIPIILYYGKSSLKTSRISIHIIRGVLLFFAITMWIWGINLVPLSNVTIFGFIIPMIVLVLAPIFLKEKVSIEVWIATCVGFIGVYITLNPHDIAFNPYSLVLLVSAIMFATLDIINKKFIVEETLTGMLFYSALVTTVLAIYPAYRVWVTPEIKELVLLAILGAGSNLILFFILRAFQMVNASSLSPYRYLEFIFSVCLGYLIFNEVPSISTIIGCAIIIPANFYIAYSSLRDPSSLESSRKNDDSACMKNAS